MKTEVYKSEDRGAADFGWFTARYSFSFGQFHHPAMMGFGALRVFNDSVIQPGKGFPEHPHENFEIITLQFQGDLKHRDVSGIRHIRENDVQVISAGTGVTHSDVNVSNEEAKQFQIWIEPNQFNVSPRSNIHHFEPDAWLNRWKTLVAPVGSGAAPLEIYQNAFISRLALNTQREIDYTLNQKGNGIFVMVIKGSTEIHDHRLSRRDSIGITETDRITIGSDEAELLLIEVPMP